MPKADLQAGVDGFAFVELIELATQMFLHVCFYEYKDHILITGWKYAISKHLKAAKQSVKSETDY